MARTSLTLEYAFGHSVRRMREVIPLSGTLVARVRPAGDEGRLREVGRDGRRGGVLATLGEVLLTVESAFGCGWRCRGRRRVCVIVDTIP